MNSKRLLLALFFFPVPLFAQVVITEVMYDLPGADTGREWIEVQNTSTRAIDITKLKFLENGTRHAITAVAGAPELPPGSFAVIADAAPKFLADNPSFSGALFKSSFSLSNSGETLQIVDASSTLDSILYTNVGAAGDGLALERQQASWIAAKPSPGRAFSSADIPAPKPPPPSTSETAIRHVVSDTASSNREPQRVVTTADPRIGGQPIQEKEDPGYTWWLALGAVLTLGAGATYLVRKKENVPASISSQADEYEIVE